MLEFRGTIQHYYHHGVERTRTCDGRVRTLSFQFLIDHTTVTALTDYNFRKLHFLIEFYAMLNGFHQPQHSCIFFIKFQVLKFRRTIQHYSHHGVGGIRTYIKNAIFMSPIHYTTGTDPALVYS